METAPARMVPTINQTTLVQLVTHDVKLAMKAPILIVLHVLLESTTWLELTHVLATVLQIATQEITFTISIIPIQMTLITSTARGAIQLVMRAMGLMWTTARAVWLATS
jgi:hypothetical protein